MYTEFKTKIFNKLIRFKSGQHSLELYSKIQTDPRVNLGNKSHSCQPNRPKSIAAALGSLLRSGYLINSEFERQLKAVTLRSAGGQDTRGNLGTLSYLIENK
jgi:hypothetical protein